MPSTLLLIKKKKVNENKILAILKEFQPIILYLVKISIKC